MQLASSSVSAWPCQCLSTPSTSYAAAVPMRHAHTPRTRQLHTPYHLRHHSLTLSPAAKQTPAAAGSTTPSPASSPAPSPAAAARGPGHSPTPTSTPKPEGLLHLYSLTPALGPPPDLGPGAGVGGASPLAHVVLPDPSYVVGPRQYRRGLERAWHKMPLPRDLDQAIQEHRALDRTIADLDVPLRAAGAAAEIKRLKAQKLRLKDTIALLTAQRRLQQQRRQRGHGSSGSGSGSDNDFEGASGGKRAAGRLGVSGGVGGGGGSGGGSSGGGGNAGGADDARKQLLQLGAGGFGQVLFAQCVQTGREVAIKVASPSDQGALRAEYNVLQQLRHCEGFPRAYYFGRQALPLSGGQEGMAAARGGAGVAQRVVLVMDVLGPSLDRLLFETTLGIRGFSATTVLQLASQMLMRLQSLARCELVHGDIQPANFLMGKGPTESNRRTVHLIDFGLSHRRALRLAAAAAAATAAGAAAATAAAAGAATVAVAGGAAAAGAGAGTATAADAGAGAAAGVAGAGAAAGTAEEVAARGGTGSGQQQAESRVSTAAQGLGAVAATPGGAGSGQQQAESRVSGTLEFSSSHVLRGGLAQPADDLESLAYCLAYLRAGELPWTHVQAQDGVGGGTPLLSSRSNRGSSQTPDSKRGASPIGETQQGSSFPSSESRRGSSQAPVSEGVSPSSESGRGSGLAQDGVAALALEVARLKDAAVASGQVCGPPGSHTGSCPVAGLVALMLQHARSLEPGACPDYDMLITEAQKALLLWLSANGGKGSAQAAVQALAVQGSQGDGAVRAVPFDWEAEGISWCIVDGSLLHQGYK